MTVILGPSVNNGPASTPSGRHGVNCVIYPDMDATLQQSLLLSRHQLSLQYYHNAQGQGLCAYDDGYHNVRVTDSHGDCTCTGCRCRVERYGEHQRCVL